MRPRLQVNSAAPAATHAIVLLELLRARMLLAWLETVPRTELHLRLFRIADESAALAVQSGFPLLVLPELFAEKVRAVLAATIHTHPVTA